MDLLKLKSSFIKIFPYFEKYRSELPLNIFNWLFCDHNIKNLVATSLYGNKIPYKYLQ